MFLAGNDVDDARDGRHHTAAAAVHVHSQSTQVLAVDGLQVQVPADLVPLEHDRTQQLRDSYVRQEPGSEVSIAALRGATLADATVYVTKAGGHRDLARECPTG